MPVALALPHCDTCGASRRTLARTVAGVEQLVTVCACTCAICHASAVTIGERPSTTTPPTDDDAPPPSTRRKRKRTRFTTWIRNPLTSRQIQISADSQTELEAYRHHVQTLRRELRLNLKSREEVDRVLRRLQYGAHTLERAAVLYAERPSIANNTRAAIDTFLSTVAAPLKSIELDRLDAPTVSAWIDSLGARHQATSIRVYWWRLRGIVRFALERGWIGASPWGTWTPARIQSLKKKRAPREALRSVDELVSLLAGARQDDERTEARGRLGDMQAKIATATLCGLRNHELQPLAWPDVDFERCRVCIVEPKTKSVRILIAIPELFALLEQHRAALERHALYRADGPVFPSPASTPGKPRAYEAREEVITSAALRRCVASAGLPDPRRWSPHSLRDSFATLEGIAYGSDLALLKERTGHKTIASLVRYLRTRSREPAQPGFALPPSARQLLLPGTNTTAAPTFASAAEGSPSSPPSESTPKSRTRGSPQHLPDVAAPVQDAELIETIADALSTRPELVSDHAPAALALPARAPQKSSAGGDARRRKDSPPHVDGRSSGERSASLAHGRRDKR